MTTTRQEHLNARDFERISRVIAYLDEHWQEQPTLTTLARHARLSTFHFDRLFHKWAGIAPKSYIQHITGTKAKLSLKQNSSLLDTAMTVGLSGPGRLHDLIVKLEAMTPGEYAAGGAGLLIDVGTACSPFGPVLIGLTARGVCHLSFVDQDSQAVALATLSTQWPRARLRWRPEVAVALATRLWPAMSDGATRICVHVKGSNFQLKVWQALLDLRCDEYTSYGRLGARLGVPRAARAIGGAVGANPVAWLIPCHRVLRASGALGGYHWGMDRKRAMLAWERLRATPISAGPTSRPYACSRPESRTARLAPTARSSS